MDHDEKMAISRALFTIAQQQIRAAGPSGYRLTQADWAAYDDTARIRMDWDPTTGDILLIHEEPATASGEARA